MDPDVSPRNAVLKRLRVHLGRLRHILENGDEADERENGSPEPRPEGEAEDENDDDEPRKVAAMNTM